MRIFCAFVFSLISVCLVADEPGELVFDGKALILQGETEYIDLGTLRQGETALKNITIHNRSEKILRIVNVRGGCGLSVPAWPRGLMQPGQKENLQFRLNTSRIGPIDKVLTLHANTWATTTLIKIKGNVKPAKD